MENTQILDTATASRQLARFEELWRSAIEKPPAKIVVRYADEELYWTILFRLSVEFWQESQLSGLVSQMQRAWPQHQVYAQDQSHVTILGLGKKEHWKSSCKSLKVAIDMAAQKYKACNLRLVGLNILNDTLIAQVIDATDDLFNITTFLTEHCVKLHAHNFDAGLHTELWWITLARIRAPLSQDIISFVDKYRTDDFGSVQVNDIELVETTKAFDLARTRTIHKARLGF